METGMNEQKNCQCGSSPKLIFACSGAADVGEIADKAARVLARMGAGNLFCLAGIGAKIGGMIRSAEAASDILVIDGCFLDRSKKCLVEAGIKEIRHIRITDHGFKKGETVVNDRNVQKIVSECLALSSVRQPIS